MKKNCVPAVLALAVVLGLSGCSTGDNGRTSADYIGIDAAKEIVLKSADVTAGQAEFSLVELDDRDDLVYYQVCFQVDGTEYEYAVDALTGVVIQSTQDPERDGWSGMVESGSLESGAAIGPVKEPGKGTEVGGKRDADSGPGQSVQPKPETGTSGESMDSGEMIDEQRAREIALEHAGLTEQNVMKMKTKRDYDDGILLYEVEFYSADGGEYDYDIDAMTGRIIKFDYELETEDRQKTAMGTALIDESAASEIVLSRVPGAGEENIFIRLKEDDGRMEYKGKLIYDGMEYEFKLDAYSGTLIEWEAEPVD